MNKWIVEGKELTIYRYTFPLMDSLDLMQMCKNKDFPHFYYYDTNSKREICTGSLLCTFNEIPLCLEEESLSPPRFYGGREFFQKAAKTSLWTDFPTCHFFLPEWEIERVGGKTLLSINALSPKKDLNPASWIKNRQSCDAKFPKPIMRTDLPSKNDWMQKVGLCLERFKRRDLQKIVLARKTLFEFDEPLDPLSVLKKLKINAQNSYIFAFFLEKGKAFLGATPEVLYERQGSLISSMALAGTRPRKEGTEEDVRCEKELLSDKKEYGEFSMVKEHIFHKLSKLCSRIDCEKPLSILKTHCVQHLFHPISGTLKHPFDETKILSVMHPTSATAGFPLEISLEFLYDLEPFDRGWYASSIGWISQQESLQLVAIRSALIDGSALHAFAGTGLVEGSSPEAEWEELESKISQFIMW